MKDLIVEYDGTATDEKVEYIYKSRDGKVMGLGARFSSKKDGLAAIALVDAVLRNIAEQDLGVMPLSQIVERDRLAYIHRNDKKD